MIRDANTVRDYYKAWDKYDVDDEIKKLEEEEQRPYRPYNPYEDSKNNLRAKPKVKMNVQAKRTVVCAFNGGWQITAPAKEHATAQHCTTQVGTQRSAAYSRS